MKHSAFLRCCFNRFTLKVKEGVLLGDGSNFWVSGQNSMKKFYDHLNESY